MNQETIPSSIWNDSIKRSSNRNKAIESQTSNPKTKARTKSDAFWRAPISFVRAELYRLLVMDYHIIENSN